jgi:hypothetical protein
LQLVSSSPYLSATASSAFVDGFGCLLLFLNNCLKMRLEGVHVTFSKMLSQLKRYLEVGSI